jgi:hypothetical protein
MAIEKPQKRRGRAGSLRRTKYVELLPLSEAPFIVKCRADHAHHLTGPFSQT